MPPLYAYASRIAGLRSGAWVVVSVDDLLAYDTATNLCTPALLEGLCLLGLT